MGESLTSSHTGEYLDIFYLGTCLANCHCFGPVRLKNSHCEGILQQAAVMLMHGTVIVISHNCACQFKKITLYYVAPLIQEYITPCKSIQILNHVTVIEPLFSTFCSSDEVTLNNVMAIFLNYCSAIKYHSWMNEVTVICVIAVICILPSVDKVFCCVMWQCSCWIG